MFGEPYDGLLVGGALTLVTSIVILLLTNRSADRQWLRQKKLDDESRAIERVYSPLYFTLWDLFANCGFLSGLINGTLEQDSVHPIEKNFPSWLEEYQSEGKLSKNIREILITNLGLMYPLGLRDDLFYFFKHLESLEQELFYLKTEKAQNIKEKLTLYSWIADFTAAVSMNLSQTAKKLIDLKGKQMKEEDYKQIFDVKVACEVQKFVYGEASAERVEEFKEWAEKFKKSLHS